MRAKDRIKLEKLGTATVHMTRRKGRGYRTDLLSCQLLDEAM